MENQNNKVERKPVRCVIESGGNIADRGDIVGRSRKRKNSRESQMAALAVGSYMTVKIDENEDIDRVYDSFKVSANKLNYRPVFTIVEDQRIILIDRENGSDFVGWRNIEGGKRRRVTANEQAAGTHVDEPLAASNAVG